MAKFINPKQQAAMDWIDDYDWRGSVTITLTFPPDIALRRETMERYLRLYLNLLDAAVYGSKSRKKRPFRCQRFMTIEPGANANNNHVHGFIQIPRNPQMLVEEMSAEAFKMMLSCIWEKMPFNTDGRASSLKIKYADNYGENGSNWGEYITKTITELNTDALCLQTIWFADGQETEVA